MKRFDNSFQRFCWALKNRLKNNHKPILLFFGNGYDSQILLMALHKLGKKCTLIHVADERLSKKTRRVFSKFLKWRYLILRPIRKNIGYKTFSSTATAEAFENLELGFSPKDYLIITGFKASEPSLRQGFDRGAFENMCCPLLRYSDEWIETLYQDMKDNEEIGEFVFENLNSDSHHNINIR